MPPANKIDKTKRTPPRKNYTYIYYTGAAKGRFYIELLSYAGMTQIRFKGRALAPLGSEELP